MSDCSTSAMKPKEPSKRAIGYVLLWNTKEREPCLFCHRELAISKDNDGWWHHSCTHHCYTSAGFPTEEEAIIAANTRYKQTCKWNAVTNSYGEITEFMCECGCCMGYIPRFCPNCGARIERGA